MSGHVQNPSSAACAFLQALAKWERGPAHLPRRVCLLLEEAPWKRNNPQTEEERRGEEGSGKGVIPAYLTTVVATAMTILIILMPNIY